MGVYGEGYKVEVRAVGDRGCTLTMSQEERERGTAAVGSTVGCEAIWSDRLWSSEKRRDCDDISLLWFMLAMVDDTPRSTAHNEASPSHLNRTRSTRPESETV